MSSPAPSAIPVTVAAPAPQGDESPRVVQHLAHELRQPLSAIETIAYYLQMTAEHQDERTIGQVEKLQRLVQHANWILDDVIHYLQAAAPRPVPVDLNAMISLACGEESLEGGGQARLLLSDDLPLVALDPGQGEHLLRNVVAIAHKIGGQACNLEIETGLSAGAVTLWATFDAHSLQHGDLRPLLEPFASQTPGGAGLALASARRIAEVHGGGIRVEMIRDGCLRLAVSLPPLSDGGE